MDPDECEAFVIVVLLAWALGTTVYFLHTIGVL